MTSVLRSLAAPTAPDRRRITVIVEAMLPVEDMGVAPSPRDVPLERFVEDFVRAAPVEVVAGVRLATWLVWLAPMLVLRRLKTFGGCTKAERNAVLGRIAASETYAVREMPVFLKMVACLGYCGVPGVQAAFGIPLTGSPGPDWLAVADESQIVAQPHAGPPSASSPSRAPTAHAEARAKTS